MNVLRGTLPTLAGLAVAFLLLTAPQFASAQATRTWVSGVGDDANPCSRTAPCKTFAGAISKTATNGEINCLDSGGFGAVTITKSIAIDCPGVVGGVLSAGSTGIIVNAAGGQVTLRHLDINGVGTGIIGIRILSAAFVEVDQVTVRGHTNSGIEVVTSANSHVTVSNSMVRENGQHGILVASAGGVANVSVSGTTLAANGATGIRVNDGGFAAITDSVLTGNGTHGATAASSGSPARISLDRVVTSSNANAGVLSSGPASTVWLANVLSTGNVYGLYPGGGGAYISFGNNRIIGNTATDGTPTSTVPQI